MAGWRHLLVFGAGIFCPQGVLRDAVASPLLRPISSHVGRHSASGLVIDDRASLSALVLLSLLTIVIRWPCEQIGLQRIVIDKVLISKWSSGSTFL